MNNAPYMVALRQATQSHRSHRPLEFFSKAGKAIQFGSAIAVTWSRSTR
jgi:hypothetical protein